MPNKSFELRRFSNYKKSNYREPPVSTCEGGLRPAILLKRDSNTGAFLRNLQNF